MRLFFPSLFVAAALVCATISPSAHAQSRYDEFTKAAAAGPHMRLAAATYFGSPDGEEFVGGGALADGNILAAGNLTGPAVPAAGKTIRLGTGTRRDLDPYLYKEKANSRRANGEFHPDNPDLAGFFVVFAPDLSEARRLIRFDWGVASVSAAQVGADGKSVILAGRATPAFRELDGVKVLPCGDARWEYGEVDLPADVFIARLSAADGRVEWAHVLAGAGAPPRKLWSGAAGEIFLPAGGLHVVSADGRALRRVSERADEGQGRWVGINPRGGHAYFGGDRNTRTNKEPWRQPFVLEHDLQGQLLQRFWEATPKEVGSDAGGLESDSSVRAVAFRPDGNAVVLGWSDGGNSIFTRQVGDWHTEGVADAALGMSPWGMKSANSLGHLMLVDFAKGRTLAHAWFAAFLPANFVDVRARNAPNHVSFEDLELLPGDTIATCGAAASGLIQTPGAFRPDPGDGEKYGGSFLSVFAPDLSRLMFSSYLPGSGTPHLVAHPRGLLVFSRTRSDDGRTPPSALPANTAQKHAGGATDGHLMLLELPQAH